MVNTMNIVEHTKEVASKFKCKDLEINLLEMAGVSAALASLRLPYKKSMRSMSAFSGYFSTDDNAEASADITLASNTMVSRKDASLLSTLVARGDEHAKCIRGIVVYLEINAPMYFWKQMDTYRFGTDRLSSESTMHVDCAKLNEDELEAAQKEISGGYMQKRTQMFSYQTLRRIYFQRRKDRLRIWRDFCDFILSLPYAEEWIVVKPSNVDYKD